MLKLQREGMQQLTCVKVFGAGMLQGPSPFWMSSIVVVSDMIQHIQPLLGMF